MLTWHATFEKLERSLEISRESRSNSRKKRAIIDQVRVSRAELADARGGMTEGERTLRAR